MIEFDAVIFGNRLKDFRVNTLKIGVREFAKINNTNIKNIYALESGKANNVKYIFMYFNNSNTFKEQLSFISTLFNRGLK